MVSKNYSVLDATQLDSEDYHELDMPNSDLIFTWPFEPTKNEGCVVKTVIFAYTMGTNVRGIIS
ncbi:uncharacterized protein PRCAT00005052001 [Priceomyces carsonii]|uniref:uncharacterized protein n=1 Tax=Priceomyces carsonii TaxID=28549 RepID=UPI002ED883CD|nr:unnamed protein product [Priceomyces carsonii]